MQRCLQLAAIGEGHTLSNPLVGCVIIHDEKIIGEGYHEKFGGPHAEVNAICSVEDQHLLPESTLYVNLEPCSHFGKTPPCAQLIVEKGIKKVVIGCKDPNPLVGGNGIKLLQENGVEVISGVMEKECREANAIFITYYEKKRPYTLLKWVQSADGFIAPTNQKGQFYLSNDFSLRYVHRLRALYQAILVGKNTVLKDDPSLTTRLWPGSNPLRLIIDPDLEIPATAKIFNVQADTVIFNKSITSSQNNIDHQQLDFNKPIPSQIQDYLYKKGISSVMVEGGRETLESFIREAAVDEIQVSETSVLLKQGIPAPALNSVPLEGFRYRTFDVDTDRWKVYTREL